MLTDSIDNSIVKVYSLRKEECYGCFFKNKADK